MDDPRQQQWTTAGPSHTTFPAATGQFIVVLTTARLVIVTVSTFGHAGGTFVCIFGTIKFALAARFRSETITTLFAILAALDTRAINTRSRWVTARGIDTTSIQLIFPALAAGTHKSISYHALKVALEVPIARDLFQVCSARPRKEWHGCHEFEKTAADLSFASAVGADCSVADRVSTADVVCETAALDSYRGRRALVVLVTSKEKVATAGEAYPKVEGRGKENNHGQSNREGGKAELAFLGLSLANLVLEGRSSSRTTAFGLFVMMIQVI